MASEAREERFIGPGVKLITLRRGGGPWVIRVIEVARLAGFVRARPAPAAEKGLAVETLSAIAARVSTETAYAIAAVNGDFYIREPGPSQGDPLGVAVIDGEIVSAPFPRSAVVIDGEGRVTMPLLKMQAEVQRADGTRHPLHALNETRGADRMVLYTPRFGGSTRTNGAGIEVVLGDLTLPVRPGVTHRATVRAVIRRMGNAPIPEDGVVLSGHGRAAAFLDGLAPGDTVSFQIELQPPLPEGAQALGGGPRLLRDGKEVVSDSVREERFDAELAEKRHPRTALGTDGSRLLLVTVDGRQPGTSAGMTLAELAALMRDLGCADAMNLDGGGSTELWVRGSVENRPSDGGERRIANALVLLSTAPKGPPVRLRVTPGDVALLAGASLPLTVTGEDEYYNPITLSPTELKWDLDSSLGSVDAAGTLAAARAETPADSASGEAAMVSVYRSGLLWVSRGEIRGSARVRVYARPPRLAVVGEGANGSSLARVPAVETAATTAQSPPSRAEEEGAAGRVRAFVSRASNRRVDRADPQGSDGTSGGRFWLPGGATYRFTARATDDAGRPLAIPEAAVKWECDPAIGTIDSDGQIVAGATPGRGTVTAKLLGVRASAAVVVGSVDRAIDDFEAPERWRARAYPEGVIGTVAGTEERPHGGARALRLRADFGAGSTTRAVYATTDRDLGAPLALRLWVRGDGGGAWLRARLRDAAGAVHTLDLARPLPASDEWREVRTVVPAAAVAPLRLESIYLVETRAGTRGQGEIFLDDLVGEYAPE